MPRLRPLLVLLACLLPACAQTGERPQPDGLRRTKREEQVIAWENRGEGAEALVFVHGWAGDHSVWSKQMDSLAPWRRIAIDLPGHGASDSPRVAYTVGRMVDALLAVLDDAHVSRAVLIGHSNGAIVARRFLELHPERVAGLVVVDGPLRSFFDSPEQARAFVEPLAGRGWREWAAKLVDSMLVPVHAAADRQRLRALMLDHEQHVLLSSFKGTLAPELWRDQPIRGPLMLVLARQPAWEGEYRAYCERLCPGLRWEMLDHVSHFLMLDEPERFDALMRDFLVKQAPFARP